MRRQVIMAALAAALAASPVLAHPRDPSRPLDCPLAAAQSRMEALESRIEALRTRFDSLDTRLQSFETDRQQALDEVTTRIELVVRNGSLSQRQIDAQVAAALSRADSRARSVAASAATAQAEMKTVKAQMDGLLQQLHALARAAGSSREDS